MKNKKLIPFEVIEKAATGEPEAIDAVLRHYTAHIKYLSMHKGHINDDTQDRLKTKLVEAILKFRLWVVKRAKSVNCFRPQSSMECLLHDRGCFSLDLNALQRR